MAKLRSEFTIKSASDGKTNVYAITSIATENNKIYAVPNELQQTSLHKDLIQTAAFNKVKASLKKGNQVRKVWITLTPELSACYTDEDGNVQFGNEYLEELSGDQQFSAGNPEETSTWERILQNLVEKTQVSEQQSLKTDANQWIDTFEKECLRCKITTDEKKLRFLDCF